MPGEFSSGFLLHTQQGTTGDSSRWRGAPSGTVPHWSLPHLLTKGFFYAFTYSFFLLCYCFACFFDPDRSYGQG